MMSILTMMALSIVLCLCSEADAFVAASFTKLDAAAKLAFLVVGPMVDIKLYVMYLRVFRARLILTIIPVVITLVFVLCFALQLAWPHLPLWATKGSVNAAAAAVAATHQP
jgi:uncharacterized membrane protein YraQ (UPF0718 family)